MKRRPEEPTIPLAEARTRDIGDELEAFMRSKPPAASHEETAVGLATGETTDLGAILTPPPSRKPTDTLGGPEVTVADPKAPQPPLPSELGPYSLRGALGRGGMGDVLAVHDPTLNRELAMKVILAGSDLDAETRARFLDEARLTAQLQHPGVVPVHELGRLPDGRIYFTMQVVRGRTLRALIEEYHVHDWPDAAARLYRLVNAFNQVCETIAFAHRHGVIHRDLKPENVMVGEFGEVRVLDWGLAKRIDAPDDDLANRAIITQRDLAGVHETLAGEIMGTPVYMSPEQARGQNDAVSRAADVYSLGAVLFHVLTGRPPFEGAHAVAVMMRVMGGLRSPLEGRHAIPRALRDVCDRAMSVKPEHRYPDAAALQRALEAWLSGTQRRDRALQLVAEAEATLGEHAQAGRDVEAAEARALALQRAAVAAGQGDAQEAAWLAEDEVRTARLAADRLQVRREQLLHAALSQAPDLVEARVALARHYREAHGAAEARQDAPEMLRAEAMLREQAEALPPLHGDRSDLMEYLAGEGLLDLATDPPGVQVEWLRFQRRGRRLVAERERDLKPTPLRRQWLPLGSHLLVLRAPGCPPVRYPVAMSRLGCWAGYATEGDDERPIPLPPAGALGEADIYVPAGPFVAGGDDAATESGPRRTIFQPGFVIRRTPVTNGEYLAFLNDLAAKGRTDDAIRCAPRIGGSAGFSWQAELPVVLVDRACARAYAAWLSAREGRAWRLPTALEWEKAARGVDGRPFPWGDYFHPPWCNLRDRNPSAPALLPAGAVAADESPYGVRDLAGNAREWVADEVEGQAVLKGGGFLDAPLAARCAGRARVSPDLRDAMTGFRLARDL